VSAEDLVSADIIFPHYLDEAYELLYNPNHQWFYKQGMKDGDVIIFKLADTADGVATCELNFLYRSMLIVAVCPHSAFMDPSIPLGVPLRASVEVRAIVIG
jgi:hypothetical protein